MFISRLPPFLSERLPQKGGTALAVLITLGLVGSTSDSWAKSGDGDSGAPQHSCFSHHLREAIHLNRFRGPHYSRISEGKSKSVSRLFIGSEQLLLPLAAIYDRRARKFQKQGIGILCDEFVSMEHAPALSDRDDRPDPMPSSWIESKPARRWARTIRKAMKDEGFEGAARAAERALNEAATHPSYLCMARHITESIARAAQLAPHHERKSQEQGLSSSSSLSRDFIELQLKGLTLSAQLDERAAPLQAQGVRIICGDVPPIPHNSRP